MASTATILIIFVFPFPFIQNAELTIDLASEQVVGFRHFWKSTGLCPLGELNGIHRYLLRKDEKVNLMLIGALPNQSIKYIRIHWLLNLIRYENVYFNFTYLDELMDILYFNNLKPVFEIMGLPVGIEYNRNNSTEFWCDITFKIAERYISRYGVNHVLRWRFETWNEPDLVHYNILNFTFPEYLQYVNGCIRGLRMAFGPIQNGKIMFGGPAGLFKDPARHHLCWGLLEHCNTIGMRSCPLRYVSFHKKGDGNVQSLLNGTLELLDIFRVNFQNLSTMPMANDESDLITRWSNSWDWRGDVRYAAMIVKTIISYYDTIVLERNIKIQISNDNAFLNYHPYYFTQRTLLARFQMNHSVPPHDQFIKKPVYATMALLSLLGNEYLQQESASGPLLTHFVTRTIRKRLQSYNDISILLLYSNDTLTDLQIKNFAIKLDNLTLNSRLVAYQLDNIHTNPYGVWKFDGNPVLPDELERAKMRSVEEPKRLFFPKNIISNSLQLNLQLTLPSIVLIHICTNGQNSRPGRVKNLQISNITRNEVLIVWNDKAIHTKCIRTYQVEFESKCENAERGFRRVNVKDTIFLSYHYTGEKSDGACETTTGRYRIRAVDYWNRNGEYSDIIPYV